MHNSAFVALSTFCGTFSIIYRLMCVIHRQWRGGGGQWHEAMSLARMSAELGKPFEARDLLVAVEG